MKLANKISAFNRRRKYNFFWEMLTPTEKHSILDIGFTANDYSVEANYLEKHYPYQNNITALGIESESAGDFQSLFPGIKVVTYNGDVFPFENNTFDIGWSNAVIEHVGNREKQILFLKEMLRTCRIVYFTTPNKMFPFDLHTKLPIVHWLPKRYFDRILIALGKEWASGDYMNLLSRKDILQICEKAGTQNIIIKKNRLFGFTMDFAVLIK